MPRDDWEDAAKKLLTVPLSNDTVSRWISERASDVQNQVLERIKSSPFFSIKLDESRMSETLHYCWFLCVIVGAVFYKRTCFSVESYQLEPLPRNAWCYLC